MVLAFGFLRDGLQSLAKAVRSAKKAGFIVIGCIEAVSASPQQGRTSAFTFGFSTGTVFGALEVLGVSIEQVAPTRWQSKILDVIPTARRKSWDVPLDKQRAARRAQIKTAVTKFAGRKWLELRNALHLVKNQGLADAACIAYYLLKRERGAI